MKGHKTNANFITVYWLQKRATEKFFSCPSLQRYLEWFQFVSFFFFLNISTVLELHVFSIADFNIFIRFNDTRKETACEISFSFWMLFFIRSPNNIFLTFLCHHFKHTVRLLLFDYRDILFCEEFIMLHGSNAVCWIGATCILRDIEIIQTQYCVYRIQLLSDCSLRHLLIDENSNRFRIEV